MEQLFMFLAASLVLQIPSPRLKRYLIGRTGASCLLLSAGKTISIDRTPEGDRMYFSDYSTNGVTYGLICVEMEQVYTKRQARQILIAYVDKMRVPLKISYAVAMDIRRCPGCVLLTDYWQDTKGLDWKVKGYTNGKVMAVLYVKNISAATVKEHDEFLDSFCFS